MILYGPPGTGKTFKARQITTNFIKGSAYMKDFEEDYKKLEENERIKFVTFHPTYSYEEFVEGYRPDDGGFRKEDGIFKQICIKAARALCEAVSIDCESDNKNNGKNIFEILYENRDKIRDAMKNNSLKKYVLIIDEINRGNISKIFGELITLLEPDKRIGGKHQTIVTLPYSKEKFGVPSNLYIIGTMNTADRSIALVDIALRRRFGFVEIPPEDGEFYEILEEASDGKITEDAAKSGLNGLDISELLKAMNRRITFYVDREKQIGHAYFLNIFRNENGEYKDKPELWKQNLHRIWYYEIIPLLQEYFYNDYEKIKKVLGEAGNVFIEEIKKDEDDILKKDEDLEDIMRYKIKDLESAEKLIEALKKV
jgi:5-methylcytosine-specific restriction protein B